jgi:hypothetical protein
MSRASWRDPSTPALEHSMPLTHILASGLHESFCILRMNEFPFITESGSMVTYSYTHRHTHTHDEGLSADPKA